MVFDMNKFNIFMGIAKDCVNNELDIGIVLYWPKSLTKFSSNDIDGKMWKQYTGTLEVDMKFGINLLREIHYGKEWWEKHLIEQVYKRFYTDEEIFNNKNNKNIITYELYAGKELHNSFRGFKKEMRNKYGNDKSQFHMSDPDCFDHLGISCNCEMTKNKFNEETIKHIYLLTHPNTLHFLQNSTYNSNFKFNKYLNKYIKLLNSKKIEKCSDNFCIDNGGILGAYGIRDTHDIDFLYSPATSDEIDDIDIGDKDIGCENKNHREEYLRLGYKIADIIHNSENHFYHFNCKFMSLKILKEFKFNRTHTIGTGHKNIRQKDINDYNMIKIII